MSQTEIRHNLALRNPIGSEILFVVTLNGAREYARAYLRRYETDIGEDAIIGDYFRDLLRALHNLLDGDCGRLDAGLISREINDLAKQCGIDIS